MRFGVCRVWGVLPGLKIAHRRGPHASSHRTLVTRRAACDNMTKRTIAYHEAGHVVVARLLGVHVALVTMVPGFGGDAGALTESAASGACDDPEAFARGCEVDAKISLAGSTAEAIHRPAKTRLKLLRRRKDLKDDEENTMGLIVQAVLTRGGTPVTDLRGEGKTFEIVLNQDQTDAANALLDSLQGETRKLLLDNWSAVERVAAAFMERPFFDQDELDALIR